MNKVFLYLLPLFFFTSYSITQKTHIKKYFLYKNIFNINKTKIKFIDFNSLVFQEPNKKIFDLFPIYFFSHIDTNLDRIYKIYFSFFKLYHKNEKMKNKMMNILLSNFNLNKYINKDSHKNLWFKKLLFSNLEDPVILNVDILNFSSERINMFLNSKGFFNCKTTVDFKLKKGRSKVVYNIKTGIPYFIRSIKYNFKTSSLKKIFFKNFDVREIKKGDMYDEEKFEEEINNLKIIYENNGYYEFNYLNEDIIFQVDSSIGNNQVDIVMNFVNDISLKNNIENDSSYKRNIYDNIEIKIIPKEFNNLNNKYISIFNRSYKLFKTIKYKRYKIFLTSIFRYRPKAIINSIFINHGKLYHFNDISIIKRNLSSLEAFNIEHINLKKNTLKKHNKENKIDVFFLLNPFEKYKIEVSFEINSSNFIDINIYSGIKLVIRNLFQNIENLEFFFKKDIFHATRILKNINKIYKLYDIGLGLKLYFPYFLFPFQIKYLFPKEYNFKSSIITQFNVKKNMFLRKDITFLGILSYEWRNSFYERNKLEIINIELNTSFRKNYNYHNNYINKKDTYTNFKLNFKKTDFNDIEHVHHYANEELIYANKNDKYLLESNIVNNYLIYSVKYTYEYIKNLRKEENFFIFQLKIETSGNLFFFLKNLFSYIKKEKIQNPYTIFGVPYFQFIKVDINSKKYWNFDNNRTLVSRVFIGVVFPYGNLNKFPYDRSYSGGGINDIRAWFPHELGPGGIKKSSYNSLNFSDIKITINFEYRFNIIYDIFGAFFLDSGNVWLFRSIDVNHLSKFKLNTFYKQFALGVGFGIRYDLKFIVLRMDVSYKLYDPAKAYNNHLSFNHIKFNKYITSFAIGYPF